MIDNDTKEKVYTIVRASNTHETLKPRDIFGASDDGQADPKIMQAETPARFREVNKFEPPPWAPAKTVTPHFGSIGNLVPGNSLAKARPVEEKPLTDRVTRLEEQVDSILERLARFNFKASHKI